MKKARVSEIFFSFQGEGKYTGKSSIWIRFFGCSLECNGFGQTNPTNPDTWELPYKTIDISKITRLEDLPVFNKGCDSSYSWSNEYKDLVPFYTVDELYDLVLESIPEGKTELHDLCFTGGEPMLWQDFMIEFISYCNSKKTFFNRIQIETSGYTKASKFIKYMKNDHLNNYFLSISPKLFNVSGEKQGVNVDNIVEIMISCYNKNDFQLKFVLNSNDASWQELDDVLKQIRLQVEETDDFVYISDLDIHERVYIMPVGATIESQTGTTNKELAIIANKAIALGYNVSGRLHANIYGNTIGT